MSLNKNYTIKVEPPDLSRTQKENMFDKLIDYLGTIDYLNVEIGFQPYFIKVTTKNSNVAKTLKQDLEKICNILPRPINQYQEVN
jgi:hypothetical protein